MTKRTKRKKISASQKKVPYELTPLSPEMFKAGVLNVLATNVPDYAKQAAELLNCDPVKDRAMIDEVSYHNQVIQLEADVVEKALNEELNDAYSTLQNACFFSEQDYAYIKQVHGEEAGSKMPAYIHLRLSQVEDLALSIDFLGAIYSAEVYAQSEPTSFSSYDADEVKHKINTYEDMFYGFILGMDTFALGLLNAAKLIEDGRLQEFIKERYSSFETELGKKVREGKTTLSELAQIAEQMGDTKNFESGRQENLRSIINSILF